MHFETQLAWHRPKIIILSATILLIFQAYVCNSYDRYTNQKSWIMWLLKVLKIGVKGL
jgi:putative effector of murein hydrolase